MDDNDFPEGDSGSEPATAPGEIPSDDSPRERPAANQHGIDSAAPHDAPVLRRSSRTSHASDARKAFAAAVLENKSKPASAPTGEAAELDPEAAAPVAAVEDAAKAKAAGTMAPPRDIGAQVIATPAPAAAPPAPSLDPEVRRERERVAAERKQLEQERAEFEKARTVKAEPTAPAHDALDLERYIDHAPKSYRTWLETMRGEPLSDEDFKAELSDFITQASADVLGVPLPEATRVRLEAALARKAVRTSKTIQTKREAALQAKAEADRKAAEEKAQAEHIEREWAEAARAVGTQFSSQLDHEGKPQASKVAATYRWLAAEDDPGKIVVDVIRAAMNKDGTQMAWQEAAKRADDYLAEQSKAWHEKRKALLAPAPAPVPAKVVAAAPKPAEAPAPTLPEQPRAPQNPSKWTRDKHMESTKAAFRKARLEQG